MSSYYDRVFAWGIKNQGEVAQQRKIEGRVELWKELLDAEGFRPATVLDIGANDGSLARVMADVALGLKFHLLDISPAAVAYVNSHPFEGLQEAKVGDAYVLPYPDRSIDLAVLSHTVEHLAHPRDAVVEAARVAQTVLVEVPLQDALFSNIAASLRKWRTGMPRSLNAVGHLHFFNDRTFRVAISEWDEVDIIASRLYLAAGLSASKHALAKLLGDRAYARLLSANGVYLITSRPKVPML